MKIFAAGIATETNTFSPVATTLEDFLIVRGRDVVDGRVPYPTLDLSAIWGQQAGAGGDLFTFSLMAWAEPAGPIVRSAYETLRDEMLHDLQAALPVDVVLLNLHGAMIAEGYDDCEEDILRRVRALVGPSAVIGAELDLHCNLTESKIAAADLVVTYKEYPHTDIGIRARELFKLAVATKSGAIRPTLALFDCRMTGLYPTSRQPMRDFVDRMTESEHRPGIVSISFAHGFHFADVPYLSVKVLAIADNDRALAARQSRELGLFVYGLRHEIGCESFSLSIDRAFEKALASRRTPVVIADQADNPGGGAPGDSTFALAWLLDHAIENAAVALIYDPEVVKLATKAGVGAAIAIRLGGKSGRGSGAPIDIEVAITATCANYVQSFPQHGADPEQVPSGDLVALHAAGIDIVVTNRRCQCFNPEVFSVLGIEPSAKRLLVVKSTQHFYAAFAPIAGEVVYMSAPGAVPPDPRLVPYRRANTRLLYPWSEDPLAL